MKRRLLHVVLLAVLSALLTACGDIISAASSPDSDVATLVRLSRLATQRAQNVAAGATLQQLDIDRASGRYMFRFTDAASTQEITVEAPTAQTPAEQWQVTRSSVSPLVGRATAAIDPAALKVGPGAVAQAMQQFHTDAQVRTLTLVNEGSQLVWYIFGEAAGGRISGKMLNTTGAFQPLGPSPVKIPPTAPAGSR